MKVVIDTNVVVSANLVGEGPSAVILKLALHQKIRMCVSPAVLAEYEKVLSRPRFKLEAEHVKDLLATIRRAAECVYPTTTVKISGDESDNRFYECADEAAADYLITGNTNDFPEDHGPTRIITPRAFLDQVVPLLLRGEL